MNTAMKKNLEQLQTLRDEIRLKIHLAKMDVKDTWNQIEAQLPDVEKAAEDTTNEAARTAVDGAIKRLQALRAAIQ